MHSGEERQEVRLDGEAARLGRLGWLDDKNARAPFSPTTGRAVLVVDLDLQASATDWHRARLDKTPHVQPTHRGGGLHELLRAARSQGADLVFIDTAAKTEADAAAAIEVADLVRTTCRPTVTDPRAMRNGIRLCRVHEASPHIGLTQTEAQGPTEQEARRGLERLGVEVLAEGLGRRIAFQHRAIAALGVCEFEPHGKAALEVRRLYRAM